MEDSALFIGINKVIARSIEEEDDEASTNNSKKDAQ